MYIKFLLLVSLIFHPSLLQACTLCDSERAEQVRKIVLGSDLILNIGITLLPFAIFLIIAFFIYYDGWKHIIFAKSSITNNSLNLRPLIASGILLGTGLGGFVDGILFHQIFQLHSMLSAKIPLDSIVNVEINMVWDGLFHVLTWLMTTSGLIMLWKCFKRSDILWSGHAFLGSIIKGWGIFNLIEGVINHHILAIHHVVEQLGLSFYDYAYLASSIILFIIGTLLIRSAKNDHIK